MIATVEDRKKLKEGRMRSGLAHVMSALAAYAERQPGDFVVFGSGARHQMRYDSDFDILVDFPAETEREARDYAERICIEHGIRPDIHLASEASPELLERVSREGTLIG